MAVSEIFLIIGVCILLFSFPLIFFLITLSSTVSQINVENRKIQPSQVWLSIIPVFGFVWQFIVVNKIALSLRADFLQKQIPISEPLPGYNIGLAYCILFATSIIPFVGVLTSIVGFVFWIVYWSKINGYKQILKTHNEKINSVNR